MSDMQLAIEEIFDEQPVMELQNYISSAALESRMSMFKDGNIPKREIYYAEAPNLPRWLRSKYALPAWEARILHILFAFNRPVLMIRGGSGCGKTSIIKVLEIYCRKALKSNKLICRNPYGFRQPLVHLELQGIRQSSMPKPKNDEERKRQVEKILTQICDLLDGAVFEYVPPENYPELFQNTFVSPSTRSRRTVDIFSAVRSKVYDGISESNHNEFSKSGLNPKISLTSAKDAINRLDDARYALSARLLLFAELGRSLKEEDGLPLTLVLDNVDPLEEYLQGEIFRELESIGFGLNPLYFRIAIFARYSTMARYWGSASIAGSESVKDFISPDPGTIISNQALRFLLNSESYKLYISLDQEDQALIYYRVLLLWRHLHDVGGSFKDILSGLTGSNIRLAHLFSSNWCLSPIWNTRTLPKNFEDIFEDFRRCAAYSFLSELVECLYQGIVVLYEDTMIGQLKTRHSSHSKMTRIMAEDIAFLTARAIIDRRLFNEKGSDDTFPERRECIRQFLSSNLKQEILDILSDNPTAQASRIWENLLAPIEVAGNYLNERLGSDIFESLTKQLELNLLQDLENRLAIQSDRDRTLSRRLVEHLQFAIRAGVEKRTNYRDLMLRRDNWARRVFSKIDGGSISSERPRVNRFEACTMLIDPRLEDQSHKQNAINVFSFDWIRVNTMPLFILSMLKETAEGLSREVLFRNLRILGYEDSVVDAILTEMFRRERRLIYSSVKDQHDGIKMWREDPDPLVHISGAGVGYLSNVVCTPPYIQWALQGTREIASIDREDRSLSSSAQERIEVTGQGFRQVLENERSIMKSKWGELYYGKPRFYLGRYHLTVEQEARCQSPVLHVLMRSLQLFLNDLYAHWKNLQRNDDFMEREKVEATVFNWINLARESIESHRDIFSTHDGFWLEEMGFCQSFVRTRFELSV